MSFSTISNVFLSLPMPDKFGGETVDEITRRWRQDHPVNGAGREPKQRFELTRFNAVLRSSSAAYLVKGLIPRGGLTVVWGPPKCGKSFWTFDLAMHVARGEPYRDRRVHQGAVVYLALEGGHGFRARIDAFRREHHVDDAPFYLMTDRTDLVKDHEALIIAIRAQIGAETPALVVVDTLNRSLAGSESKDEDMAAYIRAADAIREAFECSVVIVHHCGIDGTRPRGHTSLTSAADDQHAVSRDASDNIVVTVEWMKDGPEGDTIVSRLEKVDLGMDDDGEAITSCVVVPAEASTPAARGKKVTGTKKVALDILRKAIAEAPAVPPASNHIPRNTGTTLVETWRTYAYQGTITESDKQDTRKRAFARAAEKLQAANLIGIWNGYVWLM
jgi:AAA domain